MILFELCNIVLSLGRCNLNLGGNHPGLSIMDQLLRTLPVHTKIVGYYCVTIMIANHIFLL